MGQRSQAGRAKIWITGGNGTLGYNILRHLARTGRFRIQAPVREMNSGLIGPLAGGVDFIRHDLNDFDTTGAMLKSAQPDVIIHCAASGLRPPKAAWFELMEFNVTLTLRLFEMSCRLGAGQHFIYISSGLVYRNQGRPLAEDDPMDTLHPYGASKAASDSLLRAAAAEFNRKLTILRPFAFSGPHDAPSRLFPLILAAAVTGKPLALTHGTQIRDYCAVDDIARAVLQVIEREPAALIETFNLGSGSGLPLRKIIESVCQTLELKADLRFGEHQPPPYEPDHLVANIAKAKAAFGWTPRTSLARAVWELAGEIAPSLRLHRPEA
jgi:nucleoside-diphosphate-sugar epimerase